MKRFDLVIFDFDGTLANTGPLICACFSAAVEGTAAERGAEDFGHWLGHPLDRVHGMLSQEVAAFDLAVEEFVARYKRRYWELSADKTALFPEVRAVLEALDAPMAIASTKPTEVLNIQTDQLGIKHHFEHIQGTDGFAHKPDPEIIHRVWRALPAAPEQTLFVGDSAMDMAAGRAAGVTTVGVTHGAHDRPRLQDAGAHHVVDRFGSLFELDFG